METFNRWIADIGNTLDPSKIKQPTPKPIKYWDPVEAGIIDPPTLQPTTDPETRRRIDEAEKNKSPESPYVRYHG